MKDELLFPCKELILHLFLKTSSGEVEPGARQALLAHEDLAVDCRHELLHVGVLPAEHAEAETSEILSEILGLFLLLLLEQKEGPLDRLLTLPDRLTTCPLHSQ